MKTNARIIVTCFESSEVRRLFMKAALDEEMVNDEYVYVYVQTIQLGFIDVSLSSFNKG